MREKKMQLRKRLLKAEACAAHLGFLYTECAREQVTAGGKALLGGDLAGDREGGKAAGAVGGAARGDCLSPSVHRAPPSPA